MHNFNLLFENLKRGTHIYAFVDDMDDSFCIQVASSNRPAFEYRIPINVDAEPRDIDIALEGMHLDPLRLLGVNVPKSVCTFHLNHKLQEVERQIYESKELYRHVAFSSDFEDKVLSMLCER